MKRAGMLTPSSNTVLEPYTARMFMPFSDRASVHFARFKVTEISLSKSSRNQFNHDTIIEAASRLAEAHVDIIAWNGTSAAWLGMEQDELLVQRITDETGIEATSTMLAYNDALASVGAKSVALITPYVSDVQDRIISQFQSNGIEVVHDARLEDKGNFSFANYTETHIKELALVAAQSKPDAIVILCTNFRGAPIATEIESQTDIVVLDSVSVTAWKTQRILGLNSSLVTDWGRIFSL